MRRTTAGSGPGSSPDPRPAGTPGRNDPADPNDRIEPAEPIDRIDPEEPMERIEPAEPSDNSEAAEKAEATESTEPHDQAEATEAAERWLRTEAHDRRDATDGIAARAVRVSAGLQSTGDGAERTDAKASGAEASHRANASGGAPRRRPRVSEPVSLEPMADTVPPLPSRRWPVRRCPPCARR